MIDLLDTSEVSFIENDYVQYSLENGIIFLHYKETTKNIMFHMAVEIVAIRQVLTKGKPTPLFVDLYGARRADVKAMKYFVSEESTRDVSASVLVSPTYPQYLIATFFLSVYRRQIPFPVKAFMSNKEGLTWLKQFV